MWWLIGVIVIIAAFAFPRFGKALLILAAVVGAAIALFVANERQEEGAAKSRMLPQEVELSELILASDYGSSYRLTGRIKNRAYSGRS